MAPGLRRATCCRDLQPAGGVAGRCRRTWTVAHRPGRQGQRACWRGRQLRLCRRQHWQRCRGRRDCHRRRPSRPAIRRRVGHLCAALLGGVRRRPRDRHLAAGIAARRPGGQTLVQRANQGSDDQPGRVATGNGHSHCSGGVFRPDAGGGVQRSADRRGRRSWLQDRPKVFPRTASPGSAGSAGNTAWHAVLGVGLTESASRQR